MKRIDYNAINWGDWVYYDETSPTFLRWKVERRCGRYNSVLKVASGDIAGAISHGRYSATSLFDRRYLNHRIIWVLFHGWIDPEPHIDHIDGDVDNNKIENLRLATNRVNGRNCVIRCTNTTGITGIFLSNGSSGYYYYVAHWVGIDGKQKQKRFSILKLGEAEALRLSCEYRKRMIEELNEQGAGYTERHGT